MPPGGCAACSPTRTAGPSHPPGLLGQILAGIDSERATPTVADGRRRQIQMRRTVRAGAAALLAAAAVVIGIVVTRGPATTDVVPARTRLAPAASATAKLHATPSGLAIELDVSKLPPSPPGFYYQAWMKGPHGCWSPSAPSICAAPRAPSSCGRRSAWPTTP